jgi:hypothetical protein
VNLSVEATQPIVGVLDEHGEDGVSTGYGFGFEEAETQDHKRRYHIKLHVA